MADPDVSAAKFWQLGNMVLSIVQMILYYNAMRSYYKKLNWLAEKLISWARIEEDIYFKEFRDCDPDFYDWYKMMPEYSYCPSLVNRAKGKALREYGKGLRSFIKQSSGAGPWAGINASSKLGYVAVPAIGMRRISNHFDELKLVDETHLVKWETIITMPIGREGNPVAYKDIANFYMKSFGQFGEGFNSAGFGFGRSLYEVIR